jgi:hypothetical protein
MPPELAGANGAPEVDQLVAELVALAIQVAQFTWREPWFAFAELSTIVKVTVDDQDGVISESMRTGRSVSWRGDLPPKRDQVVWGRPTRMSARVAINTRAKSRLRPVRIRHANRQPRARAAKRSPGRATAGSRDGPHLAGDDEPPLAPDFIPRQGATAVRQAFERTAARGAA